MAVVAVTLAAALVLVVLAVLIFCGWLVKHTKTAESLKYVPPILRALRDVVGPRRRS